jgi:hypothetical protein
MARDVAAAGQGGTIVDSLDTLWIMGLKDEFEKGRAWVRAGTGLTAPTSAPGLGSPLPHLRRDWARPSHICAGTGLPPPTSAPGLGSPLPHLRRDWARPSHICAGARYAALANRRGGDGGGLVGFEGD